MIPSLSELARQKSATFIADSDSDLVISSVWQDKDELPKYPQPAWIKASIGRRMFGMYAGYPYEETLISLKANESKFYSLLLSNYDYKTGFSVVNTKDMSASEKNSLSSGYLDLHKRNLVKRVKKFTYLINPEARLHPKLFDELLDLWKTIP